MFAVGKRYPSAGDAAPAVGTELSQDSLGSIPAQAQVNVPSWGTG